MSVMNSTQQSQQGLGRGQAALLTVVAILLAADVFVRLEPPSARAEQPAVQPTARDTDVPTLVNPARQRLEMIAELKEVSKRVASLERKLDGRIRVEVINFPAASPEKE